MAENVLIGKSVAAGVSYAGSRNIFIGYETALTSTSTSGNNNNIAIGSSAFYNGGNNATAYSTMIGYNSGGSGLTASYVTAIGSETLVACTASYTTALGYYAGRGQTNGANNTFLGAYAGSTLTTGTENTYVGYFAGKALTTSASNNTVVGSNAFKAANSTQGSNTIIGQNAATLVTSAAFTKNTLVGLSAMAAVTTTASSENTMVGDNAGSSITNGNYNTFVGNETGKSATTSTNSTYIGYKAGWSNVTGLNNVALGFKAGYYETGSDSFYVNNKDQTNTATEKANSLIYGTFGASASAQTLALNAATTVNGTLRASAYPVNAQTGTTYTLALDDAGKIVTLSNASAITLTVPLNSSVAFATGAMIDLIQIGAGKVTVAGAGGVTVNSKSGNLSISGQYVGASLLKIGTDSWLLMGDLTA